MDNRGETPVGRGHRHVRRGGRQETGQAHPDQNL